MNIEINGEQVEIPSQCKTMTDLLMHYGLETKILIVELNKQILEKTNHDKTCITVGDRIEIVHFVGGG